MNVSMWMTRDVISIAAETSITSAAALMARHRIRSLAVTARGSAGGRLLGLVSATDILHAFPSNVNPFAVEAPEAGPTPVTTGEIMNRHPQTTAPDLPIEEAASLMYHRKVSTLPVVLGEKMVGIITESDIFRAMVSLLSLPGRGARITFDMSKGEDVFGLVAQVAQRHRAQVVSLISATQDNRPVCVVRIAGETVDAMLDDLWASGHLVLNVLRFPLQPEV
ncbi:MAG: CBS domain-containing protein [Verrucomicrobiota bacterium]|nr:CBS domain-containing protein [Verrucomicrobiota bacterium]